MTTKAILNGERRTIVDEIRVTSIPRARQAISQMNVQAQAVGAWKIQKKSLMISSLKGAPSNMHQTRPHMNLSVNSNRCVKGKRKNIIKNLKQSVD